jgi:hypothetical protein
MSKSIYPYENLSLVNLSRERWKGIPGFEGIYKISNYGRILSLSRKLSMNTPHGGEYISQEKVRRPKLDVKINKTINEPLYTLVTSLSKDGVSYHFSLARLVYFAFKEKFDLSDRSIYISYKDHDGRNLHISNLVKSDIGTIKLQSYKEGRAVSHLKSLSKPVTQFDSTGNPLNTFPSMYEAGKILDLNERNIAEVASGKGHLYSGFFWKHGKHTRKLNLNKIVRVKPREHIHSTLLKRLRIKQIDSNNAPAYLNLSTISMKGEIWKDVPDYKGLYQVSNLGRVKALQKITFGERQKWMPEQIHKLIIDFRKDAKGKEIPGSAFVCMAKNGQKRLVSVPRLVYYLFVNKFKISDTTLRVYYEDGNSLNLNYKNLILKSGVWSINKILSLQ